MSEPVADGIAVSLGEEAWLERVRDALKHGAELGRRDPG